MSALKRETACRGLRLALQTADTRSPPGFAEIAAQVRVGSFARPLPRSTDATRALIAGMLNMAMLSQPQWLDSPPRVETAYGPLPVLTLERCTLLEELHRHPSGHGGDDERLLLAAVVLNDHLEQLQAMWEAKMLGIWRDMRRAESIAADLLSSHLTLNLWRAKDARARYLYPRRDPQPLLGDDFTDLLRGMRACADARKNTNLDAIKTEQSVVTAVSMAVTVIAVASAMQRGAVLLDRAAWQQIDYASKLQSQAAQHTAEATTAYLQVLRREATAHPILLALEHNRVIHETVIGVARAIDDAVNEAEDAINHLRANGANQVALPSQRRAQDLTPTGLAQRLIDASAVTVWKLPFFLEQALQQLPPTSGSEVAGIMGLAAELTGGEAIRDSLALFGIDTAMMVAPAAGPIGIGLALAWALFTLSKSVQEYRQMNQLFHATLDPAVLLRGSDHEEASRLGILFDLLGLLVW